MELTNIPPALPGVEAVAVARKRAEQGTAAGDHQRRVRSLRLGWDLQLSTGGIEDFILQPSETNFLGTHQIASLYFRARSSNVHLCAGYHVPRLEGTRNVLDAAAQVIVNRASGQPEGSQVCFHHLAAALLGEDQVVGTLVGHLGPADFLPLR